LTQGVDTGQIPVPSTADRSGNLLRPGKLPDRHGDRPKLGQPALPRTRILGFPGEPYYTPGCTKFFAVCFSPRRDPDSAWSAPAKNLLSIHSPAELRADTFATSAYDETLRDDKGAYRLDYEQLTGVCSPPTISSTTTPSTIPIRWRKVARACRASTRSIWAGAVDQPGRHENPGIDGGQ
jgi:hypothetical protein